MKPLLLFLLIAALTTFASAQGGITSTIPVRDKTYYVEAYGAKADDATDDKAAIQRCIDAAEAAGGGIVQLAAGVYRVAPLATGLGLLVNGDKVLLRGVGPKTIIRGISSTSTVAFALIAAEGYNTTTTPYGASGLWVENLKVECDGYLYSGDNDHINAHGLIDVVHCPWAVVRGVEFGNVCYHQVEIQRSKSVLLERCNFVGSNESSRIQFDEQGSAGQRSNAPPYAEWTSGVTIRDCRFAARDVTGVTVTGSSTTIVELDHTGNSLLKDVLFDRCEFGPCYAPAGSTATYYGIAVNSASSSLSRLENITIKNCRFLGNGTGTYEAISVRPVAASGALVNGLTIQDNYFGSGTDCAGFRCQGGFYRAVAIGAGTTGSNMNGGTTTTTDYTLRNGIVVRGNRFVPRLVQGSTAATNGVSDLLSITAVMDAKVENNTFVYPAYDGTVNSANTTTEVITVAAAHGLEYGDTIRFTGGSLPTGITAATTYYVIDVPSLTSFVVSATAGGAAVNITATGTGTWTTYNSSVVISTQVVMVIGQIPTCSITGNLIYLQHSATLNGAFYTVLTDWSGIENISVQGSVNFCDNRIYQLGAGTVVYSFKEYAGAAFGSGGPFIKGRFSGNAVQGSTVIPVLTGHPEWAEPLPPTMVVTTQDTTVNPFTIAKMRAGIITSAPAGPITLTTDIGSAIDTGCPGLLVGGYFEFSIVNTNGANAVTLAAGASGVTITGNAVVAASSTGTFRAKKTAAATYVIYRR